MLSEKQKAALALGRRNGTNNLRGIPKSEASKRKRSAAMKAWCANNPDKVRERGAKNQGENNRGWKGGASRLNIAIRRLNEHRRWMDAVVRRDGKCCRCGADTDLEAHHVKPLAQIVTENGITTREQARDCVELWDLENGITLCEECHCKHHNRKYTPTGNGRRKKPRKPKPSTAGENNPNYKGGLVPLVCGQCGAEFYVKRCEITKRKTCSRKCADEGKRRNVQRHAG